MMYRSTLVLMMFAIVVAEARNPTASITTPYLLDIYGLEEWDSTKAVAPNVINNQVFTLGTWFGAYPCIDCSNQYPPMTWCNGGLPQLANLSEHGKSIIADLDNTVPLNFTGYIVNDYESWTPLWNTTPALYKNASLNLTAARYPGIINATELERIAISEYEEAAMTFLIYTIRKVKEARPNAAGYGYYGYPNWPWWHCTDPAIVAQYQAWNDQMLPLWDEVTTLFPSIYLPYMSNVDEPLQGNLDYIRTHVQEAVRIKSFFVGKPSQGEEPSQKKIIPYAWHRYHDGEPHSLQLLDTLDTWVEFNYVLERGVISIPSSFANGIAVDAIIAWGDEKDPQYGGDAVATKAWFVKYRAYFAGGGSVTEPPPSMFELRASTPMSGDARHGNKFPLESKHIPLRERIETHMKRLEADIRRLSMDSKAKRIDTIPPYKECSL